MGICDECIIKDGCKFANSGLIMKHCKNFIGEAPREIKTNFQRISASPEALAEFISQAFYQHNGQYNNFQQDIEDEYCYERNHYEYGDREQVILDWLKQESKE